MMSIKEEMLRMEWVLKGNEKCTRCGETVEVLESKEGRKQYFNPPNHPDRPGMYHRFGCGIKLETSAPAESAA